VTPTARRLEPDETTKTGRGNSPPRSVPRCVKTRGSTWKPAICGLCPAGCWVEVDIQDGRLTDIRADTGHPLRMICGRGEHAPEAVYSEHRLRYPMRRRGPKGSLDFERITWDEAYEQIVARRIGTARGACPLMYTGLEYSDSGTQAIRAVLTLFALAGQLDVPGGIGLAMHGSHFPINRSCNVANPDLTRAVARDRFPVYSMYRGESHASGLVSSVLEGEPYRIRGLIVHGASLLTRGRAEPSGRADSRWRTPDRALGRRLSGRFRQRERAGEAARARRRSDRALDRGAKSSRGRKAEVARSQGCHGEPVAVLRTRPFWLGPPELRREAGAAPQGHPTRDRYRWRGDTQARHPSVNEFRFDIKRC